MNGISRFKLTDLVTCFCVVLLFLSAFLPALFCSAGCSREAVCRNNLKVIGVGLELWKQSAGGYPLWDYPTGADLNPWLDLLAMQKLYTPEWIQAHRSYFIQNGLNPDGIVKTIDDDKIFLCPTDHPHPHRINTERSNAWGFNPYEYSYAIAIAASQHVSHTRADQQILSTDGLFTWSQNLSAAWISDPNASFSNPGWYCNTVGYWHKKNSANFVLRDLHVENHKYPPDTTKIFMWNLGESLTTYD